MLTKVLLVRFHCPIYSRQLNLPDPCAQYSGLFFLFFLEIKVPKIEKEMCICMYQTPCLLLQQVVELTGSLMLSRAFVVVVGDALLVPSEPRNFFKVFPLLRGIALPVTMEYDLFQVSREKSVTGPVTVRILVSIPLSISTLTSEWDCYTHRD